MHPVLIDNKRYRKFGKIYNGAIHCGYDYDCPVATSVFAIADGVVIFSSKEVDGFGGIGKKGGVVIIEHEIQGMKISALYGHVNSTIEKNSMVTARELIGYVGNYWDEKNNNIPHLHFGIWTGGGVPTTKWGYIDSLEKWVNPIWFIDTFIK